MAAETARAAAAPVAQGSGERVRTAKLAGGGR